MALQELTCSEAFSLFSNILKSPYYIPVTLKECDFKFYTENIAVSNYETWKCIVKGYMNFKSPVRNALNSCRIYEVLDVSNNYEVTGEYCEELDLKCKKYLIPQQKSKKKKRKSPESIKNKRNLSLESIVAKKIMDEFDNLEIKKSHGLRNPFYPYIQASPDGFVLENGVIEGIYELKCPDKLKEMTFDEWFDNMGNGHKIFGFHENPNTGEFYPYLKKENSVYVQVQTCLLMANLKKCLLTYFCEYDGSYIILDIERDDEIIKNIFEKISNIYSNYCLPIIKDTLKNC